MKYLCKETLEEFLESRIKSGFGNYRTHLDRKVWHIAERTIDGNKFHLFLTRDDRWLVIKLNLRGSDSGWHTFDTPSDQIEALSNIFDLRAVSQAITKRFETYRDELQKRTDGMTRDLERLKELDR